MNDEMPVIEQRVPAAAVELAVFAQARTPDGAPGCWMPVMSVPLAQILAQGFEPVFYLGCLGQIDQL